MANPNKVLQVFIPVVTSDVIQSNGVVPYINFFVERMYLASNINVFTKFAGLNLSKKFITAVAALLGGIATAVKAYKSYIDVKEKLNDHIQFREDTKLVLDKPTQIVIQDTLIIFRAINFVTDSDIDKFRLKADQTSSIFQKIVSRLFRTHVSMVTKDVFYCYSVEEVTEDQVKQKLSEPNSNIIIVDMVNDLVSLYMKVKGVPTINSVKLSKLVSDKKMAKDEIPIEQVLKSLKAIRSTTWSV